MTPRPARALASTTAPIVILGAALAIAGAEISGLTALHYVFKPLTTLLILWVAARAADAEPVYRRAVVIGLLLSLAGDVFLMLPGDWFAFGLGSFLLAHLAYLSALRRRARWFRPLWPLFAYALIAGAVLAFLWPHVPAGLKAPVAVYVVALAGMAAQAACVWRVRPHRATVLAAFGGACFVLSDAVLAIDRFAGGVPYATAIVLISYWTAQWCIARSVLRVAR